MSTLCSSQPVVEQQTQPAKRRVALVAGQTARFDDRRGLRIFCSRGELWITQTGDARDIILVKGEAFEFDRNGRAVVQALAASEMQVSA